MLRFKERAVTINPVFPEIWYLKLIWRKTGLYELKSSCHIPCASFHQFHFNILSNICSGPALKKHRKTEKAQIKSLCVLYLPCLHWRSHLPLVLNVAPVLFYQARKKTITENEAELRGGLCVK